MLLLVDPASLAIRAATGNQGITMTGFARTMLKGETRDKVKYVANTLLALNQSELAQYLGDGLAAYDIYEFFTTVDAINTNYTKDGNGNIMEMATPTDPNAPPPTQPTVPYAAFARIEGKPVGSLVEGCDVKSIQKFFPNGLTGTIPSSTPAVLGEVYLVVCEVGGTWDKKV